MPDTPTLTAEQDAEVRRIASLLRKPEAEIRAMLAHMQAMGAASKRTMVQLAADFLSTQDDHA